MLFDLSNAPESFMNVMNIVFKPYLHMFVIMLIDEIVMYSRNEKDHIIHLRIVLKTRKYIALYVKFSQCWFLLVYFKLLGKNFFGDGIRVDT